MRTTNQASPISHSLQASPSSGTCGRLEQPDKARVRAPRTTHLNSSAMEKQRPKEPTQALVVKRTWVTRILNANKTWELRGTSLKKRGRFALAVSKISLLAGEHPAARTIVAVSTTNNRNQHRENRAHQESQSKTAAWKREHTRPTAPTTQQIPARNMTDKKQEGRYKRHRMTHEHPSSQKKEKKNRSRRRSATCSCTRR